MSESQLLLVIAASAVIVALSMVVIAWCAVSSKRSLRNLEERAEALFDRWEPVADETSRAVKDFAEHSGELLSRLNRLSVTLHKQATQVGAVLDQFAAAAQRNILEVDGAVRDTLARFNAVSAGLERALRFPATKVRALAEGISAAWRHLAQRKPAQRKPHSPERISTDEEMFI
jgi:ABC-type transporter Mla subunit MlaD